MPPYHLYTARDFALDEAFQQWVLHPDINSHYFWESWLREHPEKKDTVAQAITLVKSIQFRDYKMPVTQKVQLWDDIWLSIANEDTPAVIPSKRKPYLLYSAAAAALLLLACILWLFTRSGHSSFQPITASVATLPGETKRLRLPDSSEVMLNASSRLTYTQRAPHEREVWLDGEACFNVQHHATGDCFTVHTDEQLSVQVLGTSFDVSNRGSQVNVVLKAGSVRLNVGPAQLYLQPGEMLSYNKTDGAYAKSRTDAEKAMAWTHGQLMMDEFTVADAIQFMQQTFDKHVFVSDPKMLKYKVSGSMPIVYNADTMMVQFEKAFKVQFHVSKN
jgi:transmembrane sensor